MGVRPLDIFDFLKNNIYFFIVAIFFLFKLFGGSKAKTNTSPSNTQQQRNEDKHEAEYMEYEEPQFTAYEDTVSDTPRIFKQQHYVEPLRAAEPDVATHTYQPPIRHTS